MVPGLRINSSERTGEGAHTEDQAKPSSLFVGTAGWSYADWNGIVYPEEKPRGWHALDFLSCYFNVCEINTSFYHIPAPGSAKSWARRMAGHPEFVFTAKLWEGFTHWKEAELPDGWLHARDVDSFRAFLDPLAEAGRLGCVLAQFPWSFRPSAENHDRLGRLLDTFREYPLALEVRHEDWLGEEFLRGLGARGVAFTNIDQPLFGGSLPPSEIITADFFYVRLHGRNRATWFAEDSSVEERYNYLYTREELQPWIERIERMRGTTKRGFVVTNNHFRGQGMVNALQVSTDLKRPVPAPPESLVRAYPVLRDLAATGTAPAPRAGGPEQLDLFGER